MHPRFQNLGTLSRRAFAGITTGAALTVLNASAHRQATPEGSPVSSNRNETTVETPLGTLRGRRYRTYLQFLGIPYAAPPVDDLRWRAPQPVTPWSDVMDATEPGPPAPQRAAAFAQIDSLNEDCLYLNVTMPHSASSETPQPVMVWIHGGGGTNGSGDVFDPRRLAVDEDVVVVTFNYRLGIFGAFGYPGLEDSGTFGLLDQQAVLGWVQENIADFGGDPNTVMLFGESYGALSTSAHLVSPLAEGMLHRAGLQSGLALIDYPPETLSPGAPEIPSMWLTTEELAAVGTSVAEELGVTDTESGIDALRELPVEALLPMSSTFTRYAWGNRVLPENPAQRIRDGDVHDVPVISGSTRDEARLYVGLFYDLAGEPVTESSYPELLSSAFGNDAGRVEDEYPLADYESPSIAWATVITDRVWATATMQQNRGLASSAPVWAYQFADREAPPILEFPEGFDPGAYHSSEVAYQFDLDGQPAPLTPTQQELAVAMNRYWANFARYENPNGSGMPEWSQFDGGDMVQSLDDGAGEIGPVNYADDHRLTFWASLSEDEGATPASD